MVKRKIICLVFCLLFLPSLASARETVSISELKATAPARWVCEIQTKEGETVTIDAPVHIPDVDTVPLLMVSEAPFSMNLPVMNHFSLVKRTFESGKRFWTRAGFQKSDIRRRICWISCRKCFLPMALQTLNWCCIG